MENFSNPSLIRLSKEAGVKNMSPECFEILKNIILEQIDIIVKNSIIMNSNHKNKKLSVQNLESAMRLLGYNVIF